MKKVIVILFLLLIASLFAGMNNDLKNKMSFQRDKWLLKFVYTIGGMLDRSSTVMKKLLRPTNN